jgi:hypothetical protein
MAYLKIKQTLILLMVFLSILACAVPVLYPNEDASASGADPKNNNADNATEDPDKVEDRKLPDLGPGEWEPLFELGDNMYPSLIVGTATVKEDLWDKDDKMHLGDSWGIIGIVVRGTEDNCPIEVEIAGDSFIKASVFTGKLADKNTAYCVYPDLKYDYEKLLAVKQTVPETLSFKVKAGKISYPEKTIRLQVRPVNECVFKFMDSSGKIIDTSYLFAAYVNEHHPFINQILKEAIQSGKVDNFEGYWGDKDNKESVMAQVKAIWATLQDRGIHYSAMPARADDNPYLHSQYVRLLGESINYTQANCVDGSVLMASIFRKIGLNVSLVAVPQHMFVGVGLDPDGKDNIYIETTGLGNSTFEEAVEYGSQRYEKDKDKFNSDKEDEQEYSLIDIQHARNIGIMPIKDSYTKKIVDKGNHPTIIIEEDADE